MLKWCPKYKINIEQDWEKNCPSCIFWREQKSIYGVIYYKCIYDEWNPGLKKDKINDK